MVSSSVNHDHVPDKPLETHQDCKSTGRRPAPAPHTAAESAHQRVVPRPSQPPTPLSLARTTLQPIALGDTHVEDAPKDEDRRSDRVRNVAMRAKVMRTAPMNNPSEEGRDQEETATSHLGSDWRSVWLPATAEEDAHGQRTRRSVTKDDELGEEEKERPNLAVPPMIAGGHAL